MISGSQRLNQQVLNGYPSSPAPTQAEIDAAPRPATIPKKSFAIDSPALIGASVGAPTMAALAALLSGKGRRVRNALAGAVGGGLAGAASGYAHDDLRRIAGKLTDLDKGLNTPFSYADRDSTGTLTAIKMAIASLGHDLRMNHIYQKSE